MPSQPNIVLILTDHFRRDALGRATPNLTALSRSGVTFANAYCASPLCQPSRNNIITGLENGRTGICGNQGDPIHDDLRHDTFMHHLQTAGYQTVLFGKHHYIDRYGIGMDVLEDDDTIRDYGFNHVFQVVDDGEHMHNRDHYTRYMEAEGKFEQLRDAFGKHAWSCGPYPFAEQDTVDGFIGRHATEFIEQYDGSQPFYLNLSFVGPHPPYWHPGEPGPDPALLGPPLGGVPDSDHVRSRRAHYLEKCAVIDRCVGRLLTALDERGFRENTTILFTSDHGDCLGDFGIWDKRYFYESSVGVPLLLCGAGVPGEDRQNGPRTSKALGSLLDLYPTILGLAGVSVPDRVPERDGLDLVGVVNGTVRGRNAVFAELATACMIRTGNWKLVFDPGSGGVQYLFNLAVDPREEQNLAGAAGYESVTSDLVQQLLAQQIRRTAYVHMKEEQRLQRVRVGG